LSFSENPDKGVRVSSRPVGPLSDVWRARQGLAAGFLLWLIVLGTFWPALANDFVGYDDLEYVTANPHIQQGLSWQTIRWAFSNTDVAAWHPLAWLSHALDYQCFGLNAFGHHLTAVLLHAFNAVLCCFVFRGLTGAFARSWAAAALFALHPLRVESVAWVSERKDVLSLAFFLLTLWAYTRYAKVNEAAQPNDRGRTNPTRRGFYGLAFLFFVLGLMSKPMLVTLPFVLLLLDAWPLRRGSRRIALRLLLEKIPFFVAALLVSLVTLRAQPPGSSIPGASALLPRLENAAVSYGRYLAMLFWPLKLAPFYPPVGHWPALAWFGCGALLFVLTGLAAWQWRRRPYLLVGWLWFAGTLVPVIGLVQIGEQSVADRYSYLPSIGIGLSLVWGISEWTARWRVHRLISGTLLGAIMISFIGLTRAQIACWKNTETLFRHTLSVTSGNYLAHNNLGVVFAQQEHWPEAIEEYQLALAVKPDYAEALKNLGIAFDRSGKPDEAIKAFQGALERRPDFPAALNGLGLAYQRQGRFDLAREQFQKAVQIRPDFADAHFNLALELEREGQFDQAAAEFQTTLEIQPNSADVYNNLGVLQEKQGQFDAAIQSYLSATRLSPGFARAHYNLGVALANKGQIGLAMSQFEIALSLNPNYSAARTNLAILKSLKPQ